MPCLAWLLPQQGTRRHRGQLACTVWHLTNHQQTQWRDVFLSANMLPAFCEDPNCAKVKNILKAIEIFPLIPCVLEIYIFTINIRQRNHCSDNKGNKKWFLLPHSLAEQIFTTSYFFLFQLLAYLWSFCFESFLCINRGSWSISEKWTWHNKITAVNGISKSNGLVKFSLRSMESSV